MVFVNFFYTTEIFNAAENKEDSENSSNDIECDYCWLIVGLFVSAYIDIIILFMIFTRSTFLIIICWKISSWWAFINTILIIIIIIITDTYTLFPILERTTTTFTLEFIIWIIEVVLWFLAWANTLLKWKRIH